MSSLPSIHEGTITAKPCESRPHGTISAPESSKSGTVRGSRENGTVRGSRESGTVRGSRESGTLRAPAESVADDAALNDSPEGSAIAELNGLITSLGSLSAQAQSLPLSAPTLPGVPQGQNYRPQATDYAQFADGSN